MYANMYSIHEFKTDANMIIISQIQVQIDRKRCHDMHRVVSIENDAVLLQSHSNVSKLVNHHAYKAISSLSPMHMQQS